MIALCVYLPHLASDLVRRSERVEPAAPILLTREEHQREVVAECCVKARAGGARPGMTLSQARALFRGPVHHRPLDERAVRQGLRWLAGRALRFSPAVGLDGPDGLRIDATGCTHLFSGTGAMMRRLGASITRQGFACRVACAPTLLAASALARFGPEWAKVTRREQLMEVLGEVPVAGLGLEPASVVALESVGIQTIGELARVPRAELARRHGLGPVRALDRALGRELETVGTVRPKSPLAVGRMFAGPTDRPEPIARCVRELLAALCERLEQRESGCARVDATLVRSDLEPVEVSARASSPTRDAGHWYTLLRPGLERAHLGFGVEGVIIAARGVRRLAHTQLSRWLETGPGGGASAMSAAPELARLADTLAARLGMDRVLRVRLRDTHLPERACVLERVCDGEPNERGLKGEPARGSDHLEGSAMPDRPTVLLDRPVPMEAVCVHPDGPVARVRTTESGGFGMSGVWRAVRWCSPPERIGGEWWRRETTERDYYRLHLDDGAWVWVYRESSPEGQGPSARWFLHGRWA